MPPRPFPAGGVGWGGEFRGDWEAVLLTLLEAKVGNPLNGCFSLFHVFVECDQEGLLLSPAFLTCRRSRRLFGRRLFTAVLGPGRHGLRVAFYLWVGQRPGLPT